MVFVQCNIPVPWAAWHIVGAHSYRWINMVTGMRNPLKVKTNCRKLIFYQEFDLYLLLIYFFIKQLLLYDSYQVVLIIVPY